jgi:hypothetical protein
MKSKHIVIVGILFFIFSLSLLVIVVRQNQQTRSNAAASGPLRVHPTNPRYFTDGSGKAIYLSGSHTWDNLQDSGEIGKSINTFDYNAYLNLITSYNHNFMRMWAWEGGVNNSYYELLPYVRTSSGKYDLNQFNQAYFQRLRSRVMQAGEKGIYVCVMLFEGWSTYDHGYGNPWPLHYFNANNNINGVNGDLDGNGEGHESHTLRDPRIVSLQKAYVRHVIETVDDLPNVLYEISNEDHAESLEWQYHMVDFVKGLTTHPVGMTCLDGNASGFSGLNNSHADWISPGEESYASDPPVANGHKVIIPDSDHLGGAREHPGWVWKTFTRGNNPILMDDFDFSYPSVVGKGYRDRGLTDIILSARQAMGDTRRYAEKMNLVAMTPQGNLSSTGYVLANPGAEYLVYQPGSGAFTVTLGSGTYAVEWFNPAARQTSSGGTVNGGGSSTFTPPFDGQAVLYLKNTSITGRLNSDSRELTALPLVRVARLVLSSCVVSSNG